ncbi:MAG: hypothetical protein MK085_07320 [Phycisphaerales bacterium]|nr:hypothetical protein [Phycisphaerales bacterium]
MNDPSSIALWFMLPIFGFIFLVSLILGSIKLYAFRAKEQTRREVMKSVAEGKMSADDAERLLNAGKNNIDFS